MEAFFMEGKKGGDSDFNDSYAFFSNKDASEQERLLKEAFEECRTQIIENIAIAWSDENCLLIPKLAKKAVRRTRYEPLTIDEERFLIAAEWGLILLDYPYLIKFPRFFNLYALRRSFELSEDFRDVNSQYYYDWHKSFYLGSGDTAPEVLAMRLKLPKLPDNLGQAKIIQFFIRGKVDEVSSLDFKETIRGRKPELFPGKNFAIEPDPKQYELGQRLRKIFGLDNDLVISNLTLSEALGAGYVPRDLSTLYWHLADPCVVDDKFLKMGEIMLASLTEARQQGSNWQEIYFSTSGARELSREAFGKTRELINQLTTFFNLGFGRIFMTVGMGNNEIERCARGFLLWAVTDALAGEGWFFETNSFIDCDIKRSPSYKEMVISRGINLTQLGPFSIDHYILSRKI